jgi:hypothetical protein
MAAKTNGGAALIDIKFRTESSPNKNHNRDE